MEEMIYVVGVDAIRCGYQIIIEVVQLACVQKGIAGTTG